MASSSRFFSNRLFAVVGASSDRQKFGNKVLRCYLENSREAIPVSKKQSTIEGIDCVDSLSALNQKLPLLKLSPTDVGVSIITPPGATKTILEEGVSLGFKHFYLQPGTVDINVWNFIEELKLSSSDVNIIQGCVLVDLGFDEGS